VSWLERFNQYFASKKSQFKSLDKISLSYHDAKTTFEADLQICSNQINQIEDHIKDNEVARQKWPETKPIVRANLQRIKNDETQYQYAKAELESAIIELKDSYIDEQAVCQNRIIEIIRAKLEKYQGQLSDKQNKSSGDSKEWQQKQKKLETVIKRLSAISSSDISLRETFSDNEEPPTSVSELEEKVTYLNEELLYWFKERKELLLIERDLLEKSIVEFSSRIKSASSGLKKFDNLKVLRIDMAIIKVESFDNSDALASCESRLITVDAEIEAYDALFADESLSVKPRR